MRHLIIRYVREGKLYYSKGSIWWLDATPLQCASYQISNIAGCACAGNAWSVFPATVSDPDMHHGTCVTHAPWFMPGPLTGGFLRSRGQWKRSWHSQRMRNPQFYVSGKRPMASKSIWSVLENPFSCVQSHHFVKEIDVNGNHLSHNIKDVPS